MVQTDRRCSDGHRPLLFLFVQCAILVMPYRVPYSQIRRFGIFEQSSAARKGSRLVHVVCLTRSQSPCPERNGNAPVPTRLHRRATHVTILGLRSWSVPADGLCRGHGVPRSSAPCPLPVLDYRAGRALTANCVSARVSVSARYAAPVLAGRALRKRHTDRAQAFQLARC